MLDDPRLDAAVLQECVRRIENRTTLRDTFVLRRHRRNTAHDVVHIDRLDLLRCLHAHFLVRQFLQPTLMQRGLCRQRVQFRGQSVRDLQRIVCGFRHRVILLQQFSTLIRRFRRICFFSRIRRILLGFEVFGDRLRTGRAFIMRLIELTFLHELLVSRLNGFQGAAVFMQLGLCVGKRLSIPVERGQQFREFCHTCARRR